jgi:hypothetical protein
MNTISKPFQLCSKFKTSSGVTKSNNLVLFSTSGSYVSKYFVPDVNELKNVISKMDSDTRAKSEGEFEVKVCRLCPKGNKENADNLWKLLIRKDGSYFCHRCQAGKMSIYI